jgi:transposase
LTIQYRFEEEAGMSKKLYRPEEIISKLREADVLISQGKKVVEVIKALGVTDVTYYRWRQEYGGMSVPRPSASRNWRRRMSGSGRRSRT